MEQRKQWTRGEDSFFVGELCLGELCLYEGDLQISVRRQFWGCSSGFDSHFPTLSEKEGTKDHLNHLFK